MFRQLYGSQALPFESTEGCARRLVTEMASLLALLGYAADAAATAVQTPDSSKLVALRTVRRDICCPLFVWLCVCSVVESHALSRRPDPAA